MNTHWPTPWTACKNPDNNGSIVEAGRKRICDVYQILDAYSCDFQHDEANAAFIVQAVNNHASLVDALEQLVAHIHLDTLDVRKDFSLLVARAGAVKALHGARVTV